MKVLKTEKIVYFNPKIQKKIDNKSLLNSNNNPINNITNLQKNLTPKFLTTKINLIKDKKCPFKVETFEENFSNENIVPNSGKWTLKEHIQFLQALDQFGMKWEKFRKIIKTRTATQIRTHCQKFFIKLKNCKDEELGIDFTLDNIRNIKDIINHIKSVNKNFDVVNVLLYIAGKYSLSIDSRKSNQLKKAMNVNYIFEEDIKSNTNNKINFNEVRDINYVNNIIEEIINKQQLTNYSHDNYYNNNSLIKNNNCFNFRLNNLINNYINNVMIMKFINNINNNIILDNNNNQDLNNFYICNDNEKNPLNYKISEKSVIKNNNENDRLNTNNNKN